MKQKQNQNVTFNIVYCCNDRVFNDLYLSILSIIRRTKLNINFYVLTADFKEVSAKYIKVSQPHQQILVDLVKRYNNLSKIEFIDCSTIYKGTIKKINPSFSVNKLFHTPYTYFRLILSHINCIKNRVLYLDTDVLANGDIREIFDIDINNYEAVVCHDIIFQEEKPQYFNAGVMYLNLDMIKKTHYLDKALDYALSHKLKYCDQDALNMTWQKIKFFPGNELRFNYIRRMGMPKDAILKHFAGWVGKPHNPFIIKYLRFMNNWNEDFKIWKKEKRRWKKLY